MQNFIIFRKQVHFVNLGRDTVFYMPMSLFYLWKTDLKIMSHNYQESSLSLKYSDYASFPLGYSQFLRREQRTNCPHPQTAQVGAGRRWTLIPRLERGPVSKITVLTSQKREML